MTTAVNHNGHVKLVLLFENGKWLDQFSNQGLAAGEVFFGRLTINRNAAFAALQTNTGCCSLAAAEGVEVVVLGHYLDSFTEIVSGFCASWLCSLPAYILSRSRRPSRKRFTGNMPRTA